METFGSKYRPYQCKPCGKRVHSMSALQQHTRIHRSSCPYQCSVCSKSFRLLDQLKNHQEIHEEKPFICNWCEKSFVEQYQLGQHLFRQHRIIANGLEAQFPNLVNNNLEDNQCLEESPEADTNHNNNTISKVCAASDTNRLILENIVKMKESDILNNDIEAENKNEVENYTETGLNDGITHVGDNTEEAASIIMKMISELPSVGEKASSEGGRCDLSALRDVKDQDKNNSSLDKDISPCQSGTDLKSNDTESQVLEGTFQNGVFQDGKNGDFLPGQDPAELDLGTSTEKQIRFLPGNVLLNDEDSLTDGSLSDNTRFMLRGDPSLHRCQSGDDLFMFGSILFADDKDNDVRTLDRSRASDMGLAGSTWSSSNLAALVLPNTPHKLSVDPGANSVNASPSMSPFRASIGQGESDTESIKGLSMKTEPDEVEDMKDTDDLVTLGKESVGGVDKESSVSPGHTDPSTKFPLQPDAITFKKSPETSTFDDFEKMDEKPVRQKSKDLFSKKPNESVPSDRRRRRRTGSNNSEQNSRPRRRTKSARKKFSGPFLDDKDDKDWAPGEEEEDTQAEPVISIEKPKQRRSRAKSVPQKEDNSDPGLEYNLRPKRRKTFQSLFHDGCECCLQSNGPVQKTLNIQHYMENVTKVEKLRKQVTQLIGTVFPDVKFPPRFSDDGIAVEYLMKEVTDAASERQRSKPTLVPFGTVDGEVKVVLCKYPSGCLRHFRRKISRFLTTLLPELNSSELEASGTSVDDLLTQVIETNSEAAVEQSRDLAIV